MNNKEIDNLNSYFKEDTWTTHRLYREKYDPEQPCINVWSDNYEDKFNEWKGENWYTENMEDYDKFEEAMNQCYNFYYIKKLNDKNRFISRTGK